jgi:hypothetical protein
MRTSLSNVKLIEQMLEDIEGKHMITILIENLFKKSSVSRLYVFINNLVWSKSQAHRNPSVTKYCMHQYGRMLWFGYKNGPFMYYNVRNGFSVASNPYSRIYQRISVRLMQQNLDDWTKLFADHISLGSEPWLKRVIIDLDELALKPFFEGYSLESKKNNPLSIICLNNVILDRMFPMVRNKK